MKLSQKIFLWIYFIAWAITLFIWSSEVYDWNLAKFIQATVFWGVLAALTYVSLNSKETADKRNKKLSKQIENLADQHRYIDGLELVEQLVESKSYSKKGINTLRKIFIEGAILELYGLGPELMKQNSYTKASELAMKIIGLIVANESEIYELEKGTVWRYIENTKNIGELNINDLRKKLEEIKTDFLKNNPSEKLKGLLPMINNLIVAMSLSQLEEKKNT